MRWVRRWSPALLWAAVIWVLSTEYFSAAATGRFIEPVLRWLLSSASKETIQLLHFLIRKAAHFTEYFLFSVLLFGAFRGKQEGWRVTWMVETLVLVVFYSALDEVHQAFVPSRQPSVYDSSLDIVSAAVAQLALWIRMRKFSTGREMKNP